MSAKKRNLRKHNTNKDHQNMAEIRHIGASSLEADLFEGQYPTPEGMAYNSYIILDEKVAVLDTADAIVGERWKERLGAALGGRKPDYLVVQHLEPDHSALIGWFAEQYPEATVVLSARASQMLPQFFRGTSFKMRPVKEGDTLSLGQYELRFIMAPMVHWPEVMVSYEATSQSLFSADAFGKFGVVSDEGEDSDPWAESARRYYYNICGKYGVQVQALLKKASGLDIKTVYPLHGPTLRGEMLAKAMAHYANWSTWTPEHEGVVVAYASIHGNTAAAALRFAEMLRERGVDVATVDLTRTEVSYALAEVMDWRRAVFFSSSYDGGLFPPMENLLLHLQAKGYNGRSVALVENGSWAPCAAKEMRKILEQMKNISIMEPVVTIKTTPDAANMVALGQMAEALKNSI